jgi:predicted flap endonuclease-1-like 5' DNA nuclease
MSATRHIPAKSLQIVAVGAATGALAGAGAVAIYALLGGKALAAATLAKPAMGLPAAAGASPGATVKGLLDLLLPGAVGAAGGGAAGAGLARRQVRRGLDPLRREVGDLARAVLHGVGEPAPGGAPPAGSAPPDAAPAPATGTAPDPAALRELERIRGIGPRYAALLVAGGIRGLADLARADPAQVARLLGVSAAAPMAAPARWIGQARELSGSAQ